MNFETHLAAGGEAFENNDFAQAVAHYTAAIAAANNDIDKANALTWRGDAYYEWGVRYYGQALTDYIDAISLDSENEAATKGKFIIGLFIQAENATNPYEQIALYTKFIALDNQNFYAYNNRGYTKYLLKQHEAAILDFNIAVKLYPYDFITYANRGAAKFELRQYEAAILDYNNAIQLNPNHFNLYAGRGVANLELGHNEAAILDYDKAIKLNPNDSNLYNNRGNAKRRLAQNEAAILDYDKTIKLNPNSASGYNGRGIAKSNLGQYEAAIEDYNVAIQLAPNFFVVYNNRGKSKKNLEQYQAAIRDYDIAIKLNPKFTAAYTNRANANYLLMQYEVSIRDCDIAIELNPEDADVYKYRGLAKADLGQYEAAILDYNIAIQLKPKDVDAYNNRGITKHHLGQYEAAILDYDVAIELSPKYAIAYNNRGIAKKDLRQYETAILDYDKAIQLNPNYANAYLNRGIAKKDLRQYEAAILDYDKAIQLNPNNVFAYNNRGIAKKSLGQYEAAILDFDTAIKLKPNDVYAYNNRGITKHHLGQYEAAILDYDIAIELSPKYVDAYNNRGITKHHLGQYEAAILDYDVAIELSPKYAIAYNNRGFAKHHLGQNEAAILDYDIAIELDTKDTDAYNNRGNAKVDLGQDNAAILDYDIAIKLNPKYATAYINRGNAKDNLGQNKAAIKDYDIAIELNPKAASAYRNRGIANSNLGQYETAKADYDTAIQLQWDYQDAYKSLAKLYTVQKDPFLASFYNEIAGYLYDAEQLRREGKSFESFMLRGETASHLQRYEEALQAYLQAVERATKTGRSAYRAWLAIGDIYVAMGQDNEAAACYQDLVADVENERVWDNAAAHRQKALMAKYAARIYPIALQSGKVKTRKQNIAFNIESDADLLYLSVVLRDVESRTESVLFQEFFANETYQYQVNMDIVLPHKKHDLIIKYRYKDLEKYPFPDFDLDKYHYDYVDDTEVYPHKRIALIVANSNYLNSPLTNPKNDAAGMEKVLRELGFEIFGDKALLDATRDTSLALLDAFKAKLTEENYNLALFYYAGHGISANKQNYLVPILNEHAYFANNESIDEYCLRISTITNRLNFRGNSICIFDACRNEQFAEAKKSNGLFVQTSFIQSYPENNQMLLAFATQHGVTASDYHPKKRNGLYTGELITEITQPKTLYDILEKVGENVSASSKGRQVPVFYPEKVAKMYLKVGV